MKERQRVKTERRRQFPSLRSAMQRLLVVVRRAMRMRSWFIGARLEVAMLDHSVCGGCLLLVVRGCVWIVFCG